MGSVNYIVKVIFSSAGTRRSYPYCVRTLYNQRNDIDKFKHDPAIRHYYDFGAIKNCQHVCNSS